MCNAREGRERCEKSSSCHFVENGDVDLDRAMPETTSKPGCCYGNPEAAYSKKCTGYYTERDCLRLTDSEGAPRCQFEELIEGYDCSLLWPTTTEEPGCCKGSSYKNQAKCLGFDTRDDCERRGCEFLSDADPEECMITTTTTEEPGCCMGDSIKSNPMCNKREDRERCEKSSSCHFVSGGDVDVDCVVEETTMESGLLLRQPGHGVQQALAGELHGLLHQKGLHDADGRRRRCALRVRAARRVHGLRDAVAHDHDHHGGAGLLPRIFVLGAAEMHAAHGPRKERKGCEFVFTDDPNDCVSTTTTTTPTTTTEEPGCCKGDSARTNERYNKIEGRDKCERSSSCHFLNVDCVVEETTIKPDC